MSKIGNAVKVVGTFMGKPVVKGAISGILTVTCAVGVAVFKKAASEELAPVILDACLNRMGVEVDHI